MYVHRDRNTTADVSLAFVVGCYKIMFSYESTRNFYKDVSGPKQQIGFCHYQILSDFQNPFNGTLSNKLTN